NAQEDLSISAEDYSHVQQNLRMMGKVSKNINNGINRILAIVEGLRVFTRSGLDKTEYVNIHQNIEATLIILEHSFKNIATVITRYGQLPEIKCHPGKLNQAFSNLISNSIYAIKDKLGNEGKGKIIIRTEYKENNGQVVLSFADNGNGISEEIKNSLFEPFVTTKPQGEGTGLGLSLTYSIIEEHNGNISYSREQIEVDDQKEEFTVFTIILPVITEG
ncbi:MAG: ATP-binding protein, partial [Cyclobacteriaceae bacterium]|nr:ATP-binding protein [Cyclobacteriaceae bacterium]